MRSGQKHEVRSPRSSQRPRDRRGANFSSRTAEIASNVRERTIRSNNRVNDGRVAWQPLPSEAPRLVWVRSGTGAGYVATSTGAHTRVMCAVPIQQLSKARLSKRLRSTLGAGD